MTVTPEMLERARTTLAALGPDDDHGQAVARFAAAEVAMAIDRVDGMFNAWLGEPDENGRWTITPGEADAFVADLRGKR